MKRSEGQIIPRGEGVFLVRVYLGRTNGKRQYANRTVHGTEGDARKERTKLLRERDLGVAVAPAKLTLGDFLDRWLRDAAGPRLRAFTLEQYTDLLADHVRPALGARSLAKLSPLDVQAVYAAMQAAGLSPRSVRYVHAVLNSALSQAVAWRLLPLNPCESVTLPRMIRKEMLVLSPEQARALLTAAEGTREASLWHFAIATGMRPSEILGLRWSDVKDNTVSVTRTLARRGKTWRFEDVKRPKSRRTVELDADTLEVLKVHKAAQAAERLALGQHWQDNGLVFPAEDGGPARERTLVGRFKRALKRADLPDLRLYDLRHTAATLMLQAGIPAKVASERLGHSTVALTLDTYSHVSPGMQREAASAVAALLRR